MKSRFDSALPYGIAAYDAGSANLIFSLIQHLTTSPAWQSIDGPATHLWSDYSSGLPQSEGIPFKHLKAIITGTGWSSDFEHRIRQRAKAEGVFSVAVLDHWVNYEPRFFRQGIFCVPDEIWVFDEYAQDIAENSFPEIPVFLRKNHYLQGEVSKIRPVADVVSNDVLYLLEPTRSTWGRDTLGEFQALDYFLNHIEERLNYPIREIRLRLHPSELPSKYEHYLGRQYGPRIALATKSLAEEISRVKHVVGCQTFAMVIALRAGRAVYSSLPPWAPPCALPHSGIIHLKNR